MIKGVIFDLDGTLVDDLKSFTTALHATCFHISEISENSIRPEVIFSAYKQVSDYLWSCYDIYLSHLSSNQERRMCVWWRTLCSIGFVPSNTQLEDIVVYYSEQRKNTVCPMKYADTLMQTINAYGIPIVICTDGEESVQKEKLIHANLYQYVDYCICGINIQHRKPDAILYQKCIDYFDCSPNELLYIGDDYDKDYVPAKAAGMQVILVNQRPSKKCTLKSLYEHIKEIMFYGICSI